MSILAKLLKKQSDPNEGGEVLPGLKQTVNSAGSAFSGKRRRTYLLIAAGAAAAIAGGGLLVVYLQTRVPDPIVAQKNPSVQIAAPPQPQAQVSTVKTGAPASPVAAVAAATPSKSAVRTTDKKRKQTVRHAAGTQGTVAARQPTSSGTAAQKPVIKDRATIDAWLFAAKAAETHRNYNQAMENYRKVLEVDPHNYRVMNNLASICLNLELNREALAYANQALNRKADYVSAMVNAGIAQGRMGNGTAAQALLARAVTIEPANRQALYNLALEHERSNALEDAINNWRRLSDAGDARGLLGMARIRERRDEKRDALRLYREVVADPDAGQAVKETARERISILDR